MARKSTTPKKIVKREFYQSDSDDFSAFVNDIQRSKNLSDEISTTSEESISVTSAKENNVNNPTHSSVSSSSSTANAVESSISASLIINASETENDTEGRGTFPASDKPEEPEVSSTSVAHDERILNGVTLSEFLANHATDYIKTEENYVPFFP